MSRNIALCTRSQLLDHECVARNEDTSLVIQMHFVHNYDENISLQVNQGYVDGASITYDTAVPKHIWTYATAYSFITVPVCVSAILIVLLRFLPMLAVTTTVRPVTMVLVYRQIFSFLMILCGMGSSVMVYM